MLLQHPLSILFAATGAAAVNLYVSSYSGTVTTLSLTQSNGNYTLKQTYQTGNCGTSPSWLTLDRENNVLYCLDEGLSTPNGSLNTYLTSNSGQLTAVKQLSVISGPVSGVLYGARCNAIALAHYTGSAISEYAVDNKGGFTPIGSTKFTLAKPGPVPYRQDAPHEHDAVIDPSGQYLLFPDLGADLIRIYQRDPVTNQLTAFPALQSAPGTGPRHVAFWSPYRIPAQNSLIYMYVSEELTSTVTSYKVTYPPGGGMSFTKIQTSNSVGNAGSALPSGTAVAEIEVARDNRYLLVSNRYDHSFTIPSPSNPAATEVSDSITTFALAFDGTFVHVQDYPAGGQQPRHFSLNRDGTLAAVGLQGSSRVVIIKRDPWMGTLGPAVAQVTVAGQVTCVVWDE